jgi:hypothetical protein
MMAEINSETEKNDRRWHIIRTKVNEGKIKAAFRVFRENGIEPVLIKGWAAAREYPLAYERLFTDIDLCVAPAEFEKSRALVAAEEVQKLNIDLHCGLRHLDTLDWDELFENTRTEWLEDVEVRILRPEDHLRVLCVHWLTDGGAYKEKLLDIYYLLENHQKDFDWEICLGKLDEKRREWILTTIAIVDKYYNLNLTRMPFGGEMKTIPGWVTKTIEGEWSSETKLSPLYVVLRSRGELWKQIKKRIPPNAIQATIELGGRFDEKPRIFYQVGSIFRRLKPSIFRIFETLRNLSRKKHDG